MANLQLYRKISGGRKICERQKNGVSKIYSPQDETLLEEVNWLDDKKTE